MVTIKIISGSTRPGRFNPVVASWVHEQAKQYSDSATIELVDLAEQNLPLLDEANPPMSGKYENDHTQKWAKVVGDADGFIVVTPEYNHSIPAALKNAFDYLFAEWNHKPISFVSYGSAAGGARSVEHLRAVAGELRMYDLREQLLISNYWNDLGEEGYSFNEDQATTIQAQLKELLFWAEKMKSAREELADS